MGYTILWLAHLFFTLLLTAGVCAFASRLNKPFGRKFWPIIMAVPLFLSVVSYAVVGAFLIKQNIQPKWLLPYGLSLSGIYLVGAIIILKFGFKGSGPDESAARTWPRWRLTGFACLFFCIYFLVAHMIETRIIINATNVHLTASVNLAKMMPPKSVDYKNAYTFYHRAAQLLGNNETIYKWLTDSDQPDFDHTEDRVTKLLIQQEKAMHLTRRGANLETYSFSPGLSDFYSWPIPNIRDYRDLARLFSLSARRKVLEKDLQGALQDLDVIRNMSRHLSDYPILISFVFGQVLNASQMNSLEYILAHASQTVSEHYAYPMEPHASVFPQYLRTIQVEGYGQLQGFSSIVATTNSIGQLYAMTSGSSSDRMSTLFWRIFLLPSDFQSAKKISGLMTKEVKTYKEMDDQFNEIDKLFKAGEYGIFTAIATPGLSAYGERAKKYDTQQNLLVTALAVTAYNEKTGRYPDKLADLVPEFINRVPDDPFDMENPIKMKTVQGGLDLFSVGPSHRSGSEEAGPIHFYIGKEAYKLYRIIPAKENTRENAKKKKNRK